MHLHKNDWGGVCLLTASDLYKCPPVGQLPVYVWYNEMNSLTDLAPLPWEDCKLHD